MVDQAVNNKRRRGDRRVVLAIGMSVAMVVSGVAFIGPAAVAGTESGSSAVETAEIADALRNVRGGLVEAPLAAARLPIDGTGRGAGATGVQVDTTGRASDGVTLAAGDFSMGIGLPGADTAQPGQTLDDGTVAYPSDGASANAVIPTGNGVQLLSVLASSEASEAYAYDLSLPAGHRLEATADGGARIVDGRNALTVEFEPAWARDAAGKPVPTHYAVDGDTLTQIVEHRSLDGVAYPIVADPLPVIVIVITAAALIVVAAAALGVATWLVVSWWNTCRAQNKYPELSTKNGFTARCVR